MLQPFCSWSSGVTIVMTIPKNTKQKKQDQYVALKTEVLLYAIAFCSWCNNCHDKDRKTENRRNRISMQLSKLEFDISESPCMCGTSRLNLFLQNDHVIMSGKKKGASKPPFHRPKVGPYNSVWFGNLMNRICQVSNISCCYTSHAEIGTGMMLDSFFGRYEETDQ